jgi:hypothetical protein
VGRKLTARGVQAAAELVTGCLEGPPRLGSANLVLEALDLAATRCARRHPVQSIRVRVTGALADTPSCGYSDRWSRAFLCRAIAKDGNACHHQVVHRQFMGGFIGGFREIRHPAAMESHREIRGPPSRAASQPCAAWPG